MKDNVNNNPGAFAQAYWDIAAVRVYEPTGRMKHRRASH